MSIEMEDESFIEELEKEFPHLLRNCYCGISYRKGWHSLIRQVCKDLSVIAPDLEIHQIKEKFASLRIYTGPVPKEIYDQVRDLINKAEILSGTICEMCGETGKERNDLYWIRTLCDKDYAVIEPASKKRKV